MAKSICHCYFDISSWFSQMKILYAKEHYNYYYYLIDVLE
jgi:hypothetical protein